MFDGFSLGFSCAVVALASGLVVRLARRFALKKAMLDIPNERSSHTLAVPRLGGAAFVPVVFLALWLPATHAGVSDIVYRGVLVAVAALYAISLIDDVVTLRTGVRFAVQFAAAAVLLWPVVRTFPGGGFDFISACLYSGNPPVAQAASSSLLMLSVSILLSAIWIVGVLNIYNFMDGIDGIAGVQAVIAGVGWWWLGSAHGTLFAAYLGAVVASAAAGFLTLNWPPAKIFMGDAGSTVLGFLFAVLPFVATVECRGQCSLERWLMAAALMVWPFLTDGTFTILRRIRNKENILKAHRSHLYQRLVIAGNSHLRVTLVYGGGSLLGLVLAWQVVLSAAFVIPIALAVVVVAFVGLWRWTVNCESLASKK